MSQRNADATTDEPSGLAGFVSHLVELRNRLIKSVGVVFVLFLALFPFRNDLFRILSDPLSRFLPEDTGMIAVQVASTFFIPLKLAGFTALFISIPFLLYQLWAFIAPGLYQHERKMVIPLVFSSTILFYIGAAFAYFAVFPVVFGFLSGTGPAEVSYAPDINEYLSFVITMFFAFGFVFEVPVAVVLLILIGVVTPKQLAEKRRYAILVAFIIGAIFTPPDILSQFMMAIPVWFLYELGIIIGRLLLRQQGGPVLPTDDEPDGTPPDGGPSGGAGDGSGKGPGGGSPTGTGGAAAATSGPGRAYETEKDEDFDFDRAFEEIEREQQSLEAIEAEARRQSEEDEAEKDRADKDEAPNPSEADDKRGDDTTGPTPASDDERNDRR
ncbi:twin-arginine translocase subunit TatC [Guyparkeria halophila]|uniref:Sec-independent protein translocase protein TatC n=1 Tax=Guyparkeria halophila TaxID=47960 RepID=A0A6I6CST8_9GAMM|nr:twin-arginine translocase subunit TatC [Guyparkeria halophila]QGT77506.1 twin-arginine translocase subunit TatC [Guyparkeria halophila]